MQAPQEMPNVDATQQSANQRSLLAYCLERNMLVFSIKMALVVGTLLALINHGQALLTGHFTPDHLLPLLFTYLVPFTVAMSSQIQGKRQRDRSPTEAHPAAVGQEIKRVLDE